MKIIGLVSGSHKDVTIELPILIGTVPIVDNNNQSVESPQMPTSSEISYQPSAPMPDNREDSNSLESELSPTAPQYSSDGRI